ncbi:MAG: flagellar assembly protein H, partial [Microcystaceae cyanobacterium]
IYFFPEALKTGIIVIHQLPCTPESLWLRILGREKVQQRAIQELEELPTNNPLREAVLELVYDLLAVLQARQQTERDLDENDQELIMQLSPIYQQRLEEATQQGIQQGIQQGVQQGIQQGVQQGVQQERRTMIKSLLQVRFGSIDEELEAIVAPLMTLEAVEFTSLVLQLSREELLTHFRSLI